MSVERLRGAGGLPVGTSGRALVLLSGGLDSPVAAYRMMKRGLRCDFVHFSGRPFTSPDSIYKAYALVGELDRFQGGSRLYVVTFGPAQRRLATAGAGRLQVLSQRRLMVRVASALGERLGSDALVTGDSLGQVASQTLPNLAVVEEAAQLPLLRPLIDRDKSEIVDAAPGARHLRHLDPARRGLLPAVLVEAGRPRAGTPTTCAGSSGPPTWRSWSSSWRSRRSCSTRPARRGRSPRRRRPPKGLASISRPAPNCTTRVTSEEIRSPNRGIFSR